MLNSPKPAEVALLAYDGVQRAALYGLSDLFQTANRISQDRAPESAAPLRVSHWRLAADGARMERVEGGERSGPAQQSVVIAPPSLEGSSEARDEPALLDWIKRQHAGGAVLCSVCAGAFLLARAGLLDGRPATTHWALKETFSEEFPAIRLETDKLIVEDGDIMTAGGVMAWVDLGLRLIDRLVGPAVMLEVSRFFLVDPGGREQRAYCSFAPRFDHGDEAVLKAQRWLQAHYDRPVDLAAMCAAAGLARRTFLRRFQSATGLNPTAYLQLLRVAKARELLELSALPFNQVAWRVGYEDPGALRKVFQRSVGLSPADYRRRFAVR
ncbi:MAG: GlxA family transcriptional regulator [Pseudomonadota bacterium]